jgi:hypothetical protein
LGGLSLAGAPLLRKTMLGFAPRSQDEIEILMAAAYRGAVDASGLEPGLRVVADALNRGDLGRAEIAALRLQLPVLDWDSAVRLARGDERLAKYSPDQPRDWRGRWTTGDGDHPENAESGSNADRSPMKSRYFRWVNPSGPDDDGPPRALRLERPGSRPPATGLWGGELIQVQDEDEPGIGHNEPPSEATPGVDAEPSLEGQRVPPGWDIPGQTVDGLHYQPVRRPVLPDGTPWPMATPDSVLLLLRRSGPNPSMIVFVPRDRIGPTLMGSTPDIDFEQPPGYDGVWLVGTPQRTMRSGIETRHALESVVDALEMAETNQFSKIYFNRSYSTASNREVNSYLRPDVFGVVRPELKVTETLHPREIYSPGQDPQARELQLPRLPFISPLRGRTYKRRPRGRLPHFPALARYAHVRDIRHLRP